MVRRTATQSNQNHQPLSELNTDHQRTRQKMHDYKPKEESAYQEKKHGYFESKTLSLRVEMTLEDGMQAQESNSNQQRASSMWHAQGLMGITTTR
jgi:hypothetical protein